MRRLAELFVVALLAVYGCSTANLDVKQGGIFNPPAPFQRELGTNVIHPTPRISMQGVAFGQKELIINKRGQFIIKMGSAPLVSDTYFYGIGGVGDFGVTYRKETYDHKFIYDRTAKSFVFSCKFHVGIKGKWGVFTRTVTLRDDNLLQVDIKSDVPPKAKLRYQQMTMIMPFFRCAGKRIIINSQNITFSEDTAPKTTEKRKYLFKGKVKSLSFSPENISTSFKMIFSAKNKCYLHESRAKGGRDSETAVIRVYPPKNGKLSFLLDLRQSIAEATPKSNETYAGIDFWKDDHLRVPNFSYSRNLIQNPSFEAGLHYYTLQNSWGDYRPRQAAHPIYSTTDKTAKFGNRSLEIKAIKGRDCPGYLQTFCMPVKADKKYTFSFYAKGECKGLNLQMNAITGEWGKFLKFDEYSVPVGEWKRYSMTFTTPNTAMTLLIRGRYRGKAPAGAYRRIWIDGMQLEEGDKCGKWMNSAPIQGILTTSDEDNFLKPGEPVDAKLRITAAPDQTGSVTCSLSDFFYKKIWESTFKFRCDAQGVTFIDLSINDKVKNGIYLLTCRYNLGKGGRYRDIFRITRMKPVPLNYKNKNITGSNFCMSLARKEDLWKRLQTIGMQSFYSYVTSKGKELFEVITKEYNFHFYGTRMVEIGGRGKIGSSIGKFKFDFPNMLHVTPEIEKRIEEACYQKAKAIPWIDKWYFAGECDVRGGAKFGMLKTGNYKDFAKLLLACRKGIKRYNPKETVYLTGGPSNIAPNFGAHMIDKWLEAANNLAPNVKFDGIHANPYRSTPESPDLDDDAANLFRILERRGYGDVPVYWSEGIYYNPYNIPEWGLNPHQGCTTDHWRAGAFSYDMGWGERIAAAYFARSWLVGLKYQDKVKIFNGWMFVHYIDAYLTPLAVEKIPNTLGNILGEASFHSDIRFAPKCRAYIFEDEKKRPVAAIWSHITQVDHGFKQSPIAETKFKGELPEFIDLMENHEIPKVDENGFVTIPITPFPIFIRSKPGTMKTFCESISNMRLLGAENSPVRLFTKPTGLKEVDVTMINLISRKIVGKGVIETGGKKIEEAIDLRPCQKTNKTISLVNPLSFDKIKDISVMMSLKLDSYKNKYLTNGSFRGFAANKLKGKIKIDGNIDDWKNIPAIHVVNKCVQKAYYKGGKTNTHFSPGDLEAKFRVSWDDENLYLLIEVVDDKLVNKQRKKIAQRYLGDSVQIYIDTFGDGRLRGTIGFDGNDYEYDLFPNLKDDSLTVYRRYAPEQQIAGGLYAPRARTIAKKARSAFKRTSNGYLYEVAFPKNIIAPMQLKAGTSVGFCLFINDVDKVRWEKSLTLTPEGTGGHRNTHLYPVMLLTDEKK